MSKEKGLARVGRSELAFSISGPAGAEAVLLIMGLATAGWGWDRQVPALSRRFRVITYDHRGVGRSPGPVPSGYEIGDMAADALGLLDFLGVDRAHVAGVSMGGYIAQSLAIEEPGRVGRLVLCSTSCGGPDAIPPPKRLWLDYLALHDMEPGRAGKVAAECYFGPSFEEENPRLAQVLLRHYLRPDAPRETLLAQAQACTSFDESRRVGGIEAPTLVAHGTADALLPVENARLLASLIPRARLLLYPGAGHALIAERAVTLNRVLVNFLGGQPEENRDRPTM